MIERARKKLANNECWNLHMKELITRRLQSSCILTGCRVIQIAFPALSPQDEA